MNINLHIERLILDGVDIPSGQRPLVQAAVEAELTRLLTAGGLSPALTGGGTLHRVSTNAIQLTNDAGPTDLGRQIAGSVYGGIGK